MSRKERRRLAGKKKFHSQQYVEQLFEEMERDGEIARTGEMQPDRNGMLQAVYVLREFAKRN